METPLNIEQQNLAASFLPKALQQARTLIRRVPGLRDDLESAAALGCIDAARRYKKNGKFSFEAFAHYRVLDRVHQAVGSDCRRNRLIPRHPDFFDSDAEVASSYGQPDLESRETVDFILKLARPRERIILRLIVLDGLTQPETAEKLGMSKQTVYREWRRGRERIARALREEQGGETGSFGNI